METTNSRTQTIIAKIWEENYSDLLQGTNAVSDVFLREAWRSILIKREAHVHNEKEMEKDGLN
jgi:hypothetical protein